MMNGNLSFANDRIPENFMLKYSNIKAQLLLFLILVVTGCTAVFEVKETDYAALYGPSEPKQRVLTKKQYQQSLNQDDVSFVKDIKPILDSRCVACHGCYDAPCQLKLSSFEGLDRGATKQKVYDGARLEPAAPTRLFIDATDTAGWREKEFFPVLNERINSSQAELNNSLLAKLLQLKRDNPLPESGKLDDSFKLDIDRTLECPTVEEFAQYQFEHPKWGMPYAMPGLSLKEEYTIMEWLQQGAKISPRPPLSKQAIQKIAKWESFFNGSSLKQQLVFRYIYEHLFIGHIHFRGHPDNEFFRLVRSSTPPGKPVAEIATLLPYDDPGVEPFYYRLRPVDSTIVDKIHFVYELSNQKMKRYKELFFQSDYTVTELPSYQPKFASNPFKTFIDIPYISRYQFLLDDAQYFVSGFIKGPVCRGQVALNVIRDRFWVVFLNPGGLSKNPEMKEQIHNFMVEQNPTLSLPAGAGDDIGLFGWRKYSALAEEYLKNKDAFANQLIDEYGGFEMDDIWDGDDVNQNAALTVFRHFDSATVVKGLVGKVPLTAWVVDYPIFERIHYLLVAGFNVYSTVGHQLAARMYMDFLRMDGENNFLRFIPIDQRKALHDSWYKGLTGRIANSLDTPYYSKNHESGIVYKTDDSKKEFFELIRHRLGKAAGKQDKINQCEQEACITKGASPLQQLVDDKMRQLANLRGQELDILPGVSFVRVKNGGTKGDLVYTLLINKALENVAFMIAEDIRREPAEDTITVVPGFLGSYPNIFFNVEVNQLGEFIDMIKNSRSVDETELFFSRFAIRRTNPEIWQYTDWFNEQHKKERGERAGLFDMNRYQNL